MNASDKFIRIFKSVLPAPFSIAVALTAITYVVAVFFGDNGNESTPAFAITVLEYWENGLWNNALMVFALQAMLMLVLGHVLALTKSFSKIINIALKYCNTTANAATLVTLLTIIVSLFNWGLGLVFGAIFARKVGEYASKNNIKLNYPLIGAAGYSGMMVWHGGLSGSAPIKVAEPGHFLEASTGIISQGETVFSAMNVSVTLALLIVLPLSMYFIGKKSNGVAIKLRETIIDSNEENIDCSGAEKLDNSKIFGYFFGLVILGFAGYKALIKPDEISLSIITPNYINFILFGLAILLHGNFYRFLKAIDAAISGASGILIQFPLYFGIMGIMKDSGLVVLLSDFFVKISTATTFPIYTLVSASIVNIFVPSGGGQWAVQGPIIVNAANQLGVSLPKSIMALAYGDELTNMLQPFWALPLLGITELKAKEILPYTILLMLLGGVIFTIGLLIF